MNLNKVILIGRLTADPELRTTNSGNSVGSFSIATNRVWNGKDGQKNEETEFHNIVVWGRQAEIVSKFLNKGSLVMIEGRLQTRSWETKEGQTRRTTEVVAERVQFGPRDSSSPSNSQASNNDEEIPEINLDDDDGGEIDIDKISF